MDLEIYTDGAYSPKLKQMGIGIVFLENSKKLLEYSRKYSNGTNNMAELGAIIVAMRIISKPVNSITIYSDSMYCIGSITLGWKRKKNGFLWKEFDKQYQRLNELCPTIEFKYIKGHQNSSDADSYWNNYVDNLANFASQTL